MVFPYYPRPEDDTQEPEEEQQQQGSPSHLPFYLSYIYPAPPAPDTGYVAPGESHPLPSGPYQMILSHLYRRRCLQQRLSRILLSLESRMRFLAARRTGIRRLSIPR